MIDKLAHKGQISKEEHKQMLDKLKGHDKQVEKETVENIIITLYELDVDEDCIEYVKKIFLKEK